MTRFSGAVLVGGRSTRLGVDKATLFAETVTAALRAAGATEVRLIGRDQPDDVVGVGPLGGLVTALRLATEELVVVLACDLPRVDPAGIRRLVDALAGAPDADVALPPGEPLHAAWRRRALPAIQATIESGRFAVRATLDDLAVLEVEGIDPSSLINVNTPADLVQTARVAGAAVPEIDVAELARRHVAGAVIIDVRRQAEYDDGHVAGAVLIPLDQLDARWEEVPTGTEVAVICRTGARDARAVAALNGLGRQTVNVAGGTLAWIDAGHAVVLGPRAAVVEHAEIVVDAAGLAHVVEELADQPEYAVDTEFHRERTYFPKVALVQLAWPGRVVLVDPLAVDLAPFASVLLGPGVAIMHAANQDLEVLHRACGAVPSTLFDTQLAAGFVGFSTPSLALLAERVLGVHLPKASRLTDWLHRPLGDAQQTYAAADVLHLADLAMALRGALAESSRLGWAEEECEYLRTRDWGPPDPEQAWLRLKEARQLRGRARGVARAVAAWRERRAAELDTPVRHVLPDLALVGIASNPPTSLADLKSLRGVDDRHTRGPTATAILAAVQEGLDTPQESTPARRRDEVDRDQRPAVALASAWLSQLARELKIDAALLATRNDLSTFLNEDPSSRLALGWRHELLGEPIRRLVAGNFALAFDGRGGLTLEKRSGQPVTIDLPVPTAPWTKPG